MLKHGMSIFLLCCGVAHATSSNSPDTVDRILPSVSAPHFVTMAGEYRVCKTRPDARTLVLEGMCLWERELSEKALEHPKAVAGLVVERAGTLSVDEYLQQQLDDEGVSVRSVRIDGDKLLVEYAPTATIFLSSQ